eukprot:PhF_6_TR33020/c0_g1_i1/m.48666/K03377/CASD1; N-acetylneuraminate 9-O-acetyltransferase
MRRGMTHDPANPDGSVEKTGDGDTTIATSPHTWLTQPFIHVGVLIVSVVGIFLTMYVCHVEEGYRDLTTGQVLTGTIAYFFGLWWVLVQFFVMKEYLLSSDLTYGMAQRKVMHAMISKDEDTTAAFIATTEFFGILVLFYVCDRTPLIDRAKKKYNKDTFWFLWFVLMMVGAYTLKKAYKKALPTTAQQAATGSTAVTAAPEFFHMPLLQRDQTEEWKGWMQVMFLWYHYFHAVDLYNAIRLYIAAYVWMTGFGNFSYYYVKKDFSAMRFAQMMWRLNFFVVWACLALDNEYMLYYICMLHTTFTVFIYAGLGFYNSINQSFSGIVIKFVALTVITLAIWDTPRFIFDLVWLPFRPVVVFHDPYKPQRDPMHEWYFRSTLDHLIWIYGMFCAYNHPKTDGFLEKLDTMPSKQQYTIKGVIIAITLAVSYVWYENVFTLNKFEYNKLHPFTSFIPITAYIILRNISGWARMYHMHLFEWLGKITLETYIAQFHIWMATTGPNGSPKLLLRVFPETWPLMNFAFFSIAYTYVSYRIFQSSNTMKSWCLPSKDPSGRVKFLMKVLPVLCVLGYLVSEVFRRLVHAQMNWSPKQ